LKFREKMMVVGEEEETTYMQDWERAAARVRDCVLLIGFYVWVLGLGFNGLLGWPFYVWVLSKIYII
jgi:hypothetical protein